MTNLELAQKLLQRLNACASIGNFDRSVYVEAYGEQAVDFIEQACETMADVDRPEQRIQAMLNISYDKGFADCIQLVINVIEACGIDIIKGGNLL